MARTRRWDRLLKSGWTVYGFEALKGDGVSMEGLREALQGLDAFDEATDDFTPAWAAIIPYLHRETMQRFRRGHQPATWPARKHAVPWPMLNHTGKLKDSIFYKSNAKQLVQSTRSVKYAWYQQVGSRYKKYLSSRAASALIGAGKAIRPWWGGGRRGKYNERIILADGSAAYVSGNRRSVSTKGKPEMVAGKGGLAARPFLFLEFEKVDEIREMLIDYVLRVTMEPQNARNR